MPIFLLFLGYILFFLGIAAVIVPVLHPLLLDHLDIQPATALYRFAMLAAALALPFALRAVALNSWYAAGYTLPARLAWVRVAQGIVIGAIIMLALTGTQWLLGMHQLEADATRLLPLNLLSTLLAGAVSGLAVGFIEETFFRGLMHTGMRRHLGLWSTAILTSLLYAALHFIKPEELGGGVFDTPAALNMIGGGIARLGDFAPFVDSFVTLVVVGLFLSLVRERTGNILWAIGIHAGWVMMIKLTKYVTDPTLIDGRASAWIGAGYDHITGWMATIWLGVIIVVYWYLSKPAQQVAERRRDH